MKFMKICCSRRKQCYECLADRENGSDNVENVSINFLEEPQTPEILSSNQFGTPVLDDRQKIQKQISKTKRKNR